MKNNHTNPHPASSHSGSKDTRKVFDVSHPGKAPASPTSRPVIMGHKSEAQHAQIAISGIGEGHQLLGSRQRIEVRPSGDLDGDADKPSQEGSKVKLLTKAATIEPPKGLEEALKAKEATKKQPNKEGTEALATTALRATTEPPTEVEKPKVPEEPAEPAVSEPEPSAAGSSPEATDTSGPSISTAPTTPEPGVDIPSYDELPEGPSGMELDHHEIVVSHHGSTSGLQVFLLLLLVVVLAVIAADILLDAGIIKFEGIPHTNFLS